jgi:predicted Zn-dependent peptidase
MYEQDDLNGSTHFWEHILFRKLNHMYHGEFYKCLDKHGLSFSASTYKEFMAIKITGAAKHFEYAAKVISLVFEPLNLMSYEIELEKKRYS